MASHKRLMTGKGLVVLLIIGLIIVFFSTGMHHYLTLDFIKDSRLRFQEIYSQNPVGVIAAFVAFYIPAIALNLPGAAVFGLAAGALFGTLAGTIIISFASSIGAVLACLLSRYLLRDWIQNRFGASLKTINEGISKEGVFYLFSLRLIPVIPFFLINMAMGLMPIRLWTFYWVSQLGMLPGTAIFVNAGSQLSQIKSMDNIVSPGFLVSLALLGLFPLIIKKIITRYRSHTHKNALKIPETGNITVELPASLQKEIETMANACTNCGACKRKCAFLQEHGTPKEILETVDFTKPENLALAFECSLCNLCGAICPENLDPRKLFFTLRQQAIKAGTVDLSTYRRILGYEARGNSPLFAYHGLPNGCDTVFFPGCTLPGTRPETTWQIFTTLQQRYPALGVVLDCCTKPSHDLGRQDYFNHSFGKLNNYLVENNIKKVVVACPNCYAIFKHNAKNLVVETVYEVINSGDLPIGATVTGEVAVHDPCPLRGEKAVQDSVRAILTRMGLTLSEMKHHGKRTLCCGEGGSVGLVRPDLAKKWGQMRRDETNGRKIVTYCAGCAGFLNRVTPTVHLADVVFAPQKVFQGNLRVAKSPFTYLNRIRLKRRFKKALEPVMIPVDPNPIPDIPIQQKTDGTKHFS